MGVIGIALVCLGLALAVYGVLMGVLYPANGFFLAWVLVGLVACWAGWAQRTGAWAQVSLALRRVVCVGAVVLLVGVGSGCALIWRDASATPPAGLDYLVVLGASLNHDGTPKETLAFRLDAARAYLDQNPRTRCVLSGGRGPDEPQTEASAMASYLRNRGVSASRLVLEQRSTSTAENLRFSRDAIGRDLAVGAGAAYDGPAVSSSVGGTAAEGVRDVSVGVVTNDFHVFRAVRLARGQGFARVWGVSAPTNPLYLPQALVRECFAVLKDALTGAIAW